MAYVNGPLHSKTAAGKIAKTTIYQTYRGRTYAKAYAVPGPTPGHATMNQTPAQLEIQAFTKALMQHWPEISTADQATWDALALPKRISRVNAYLRYNYARRAVALDPTDVYPPATPPVVAITVGYYEEMPDPDCTGDYALIGEYDGQPLYERIAPPAFLIMWIAGPDMWIITQLGDDPPIWANGILSGVYQPVNTGGYPNVGSPM